MKALVVKFFPGSMAIMSAVVAILLAMQAQRFLIERYRLSAVLGLGVCSAALFVAGALFLSNSRWSSIAACGAVAGSLSFVVLGLSRMGGVSLMEAFHQASCVQGSGLCFPQSAVLVRLLALLFAAVVVSAAVRRLAR